MNTAFDDFETQIQSDELPECPEFAEIEAPEPPELSDVEADAMTLASAGYGTDEDYAHYDIDAAYEERFDLGD